MMSRMIIKELLAVLRVVFCGALITMVYDVLRIVRRLVSHGNFWIGVEDFLFWIWTALWIFSILYRENDGSLRVYTILAMGGGMIGYHGLLSELLVGMIAGVLQKLIKMMCKPFRMVKIYIIFCENKLKNFFKRSIMKNSHE